MRKNRNIQEESTDEIFDARLTIQSISERRSVIFDNISIVSSTARPEKDYNGVATSPMLTRQHGTKHTFTQNNFFHDQDNVIKSPSTAVLSAVVIQTINLV